MKIEIDISDINENSKNFFVEMLPYISVHIEKVETNEGKIYAHLTDPSFETEVLEKSNELKSMIKGGKLGDKEIPIKNITDHSEKDVINKKPVFNELTKREHLIKIQDGVYAYSGIVLSLIKYFNNKIREFAYETFESVREHEYPVLYPINKFEKGRYFENFPHFIMFQTTMKNDIEVLDRFSRDGTKDSEIFKEMTMPKNVLRNAACVPVYEFLENRVVNDDRPEIFLVLGKCFRNESENVFELARLNEFTMKEIVIVGTPKHCKNGIEKAKKLWDHWMDVFDLNCKIDTANDSFFASNYKKLKLFQILGDSKQEFKWYVPSSDSYIACSSANFHRTHFTKPYNIRNKEGTYCNSACFAFGLERMLYALLSQKGIDPSGWDKKTYDEISKYVDLEKESA